jgi:hypothetical protein
VRHAHLPAVAFRLDVDERPRFEPLDARAVRERIDGREGDRLADTDDLQRMALGLVQRAEAHADELGQPR